MFSMLYCGSVRGFLAGVFLVGVFSVLIVENAAADEVPAFFLKIAKNIPRVGRSDGYEDSLYKTRKNIGKIGGHESGSQVLPESWSSYGNEEPFVGPTKRRMDYSPLVDARSWQHFPLAIEGPRELWRTLAGYSQEAGDDIDNEIWKRKKRTEGETMNLQEN